MKEIKYNKESPDSVALAMLQIHDIMLSSDSVYIVGGCNE